MVNFTGAKSFMKSVTIIAEAGVNHNGDLSLAKKLVAAAADAKADYVKFQTFKAENLVTKGAKKATYQQRNIGIDDDSQFNMLKKLELSHKDHIELIKYAKSKNIGFFSTAFDNDGLNYLNDLGFEFFKVPSGEITNYPYLKLLSKLNKPVILSTGMADMDEIKSAVEVLVSGNLSLDDITVLHCNTEYPTPMSDVNLMAMLTIKNELGVNIGYSDHTMGIEVPIAAVALGAKVIEKHFTLNRGMEGPDHVASLEPDELKDMVSRIRNIEHAISGDEEKVPSKSEKKNIEVARKSIFARRDISKGVVISEEDLIALRPGTGISPMKWESVIGCKTKAEIPAYSQIDWDDIK